jgi:hypothetical protein
MLVVEVHAKNETRSFEFDQPVITIGRADVNDIVLPTAKVSKRHARLEVTPQGLILNDIKSTNGTYLNGRKVLAQTFISDSDRIHIGEFVITVHVSSGLPSGPPPTGFVAETDASAATEPSSGLSPESENPESPPAPKRPSGEIDTVSKRGAAHRISWLDQWVSNNGNPGQHKPAARALDNSSAREVSFSFVLHASMPAVVPSSRQTSLRVWADARHATRSEGMTRQQKSCALEINVCLPDGKLEAFQADQGLLQVLLGGHSADLLIPLRGRENGPARVEVTVCHRGARLATLMLRPEVRTLHSGDSSEPLVQSEIQASTPLETVLSGCGPQAVLRVREYGPIGEAGGGEQPMSTSGSHGTEASRRRRLKVELAVVHDEMVELVAGGESPIDLPLADRVRAALSTQELERLGAVDSGARETMLQGLGESLAQQILPTPVRDALLLLQPGTLLEVDCTETWVPWELFRVGRGLTGSYLAERFALSRGGTGSHTSRFEASPRVLLTPKGVEALVRREQQCLALLDPRLRQIHRVSDLQPLLMQGGGPGGIAGWHVSGQGAFDRGDKSAASLHLEDGVLTPVQIVPAQRSRKSGQTPPFQGAFIFLNVSEPSPPPTPLAPAGTVQWIERFLSAGAGAVVATTWPIASAKAGQFVEMFYRAWSQNRPLAVAISEARESIRAEGDVSWLSFAVYGLPGARHGAA